MTKLSKRIFNLARSDKLVFFFCLLVLLVPIMKTPNLPFFSQKLQVSELAALMVIFFFALEIFRKGVFPAMPLLMIAAAIHLGWMLISLVHSGWSFLTSGAIEIAVQAYLFLLFFVAAYISSTRNKIDEIFSAWSWSLVMVLVLGLAGLVLFAFGWRDNPFVGGIGYNLPSGNYPRVMSTFVHGSYLANFMAPSFFLLAYLHFSSNRAPARGGWFWAITFLFIVIGFATLSRSFLIWIAMAITWAAQRQKADRLIKAGALSISAGVLALTAVITVWMTFPVHLNIDQKQQRLELTLNTKPSPRIEIWRQVWPSIKGNPFWGRNLVEASGPAWVAGRFEPQGVSAHNTWLQLWATRGIFGLLSFLLFLVAAVKSGLKKPLSPEQKFMLPALISLLLISFIEHLVHVRFVYLLLGLFSGPGKNRD